MQKWGFWRSLDFEKSFEKKKLQEMNDFSANFGSLRLRFLDKTSGDVGILTSETTSIFGLRFQSTKSGTDFGLQKRSKKMSVAGWQRVLACSFGTFGRSERAF